MKKPSKNAPRIDRRSVCGALALLPLAARAQLRVEITGVGGQQFPIAIAPFAQDAAPPQDVAAIVRADLTRSGLFRIVDAGTQPIAETASVNLADWKTRGADALVTGSVRRLADGRYDVRFRLLDTVKQAQLDGLAYVAPAAELRLTAHRIADRIYEKLTGERGVFATRIAYVVQTARNAWELHVADADGENAQAALRSREPIISPAWAPDGVRLAYVSFETGKPVVYVHTVTTGERKAVANFRGSNSAPAWSPDGRSLAVTLTREGNSQIFLMNADGSNVRRLTQSSGIDTEPVFSPDGQWIYFTSDRGGGPQIYRMPATGGAAQRITFSGDYNISPRLSPDGKLLAYVARRSGRFQVMVLDLASATESPVTDTVRDESPSFAPNGRLLLYATEVNGRGILASASVDGRVRTRLSGPSGDIREPTWGPYIK
ncbi:MAG TPA: Tol-Pal system beta propeller repeat protein TolB [Burkholderiaceae bacterium]|nr:Tol-Pal system beta propeller repeat protein TolB [Burkholderiaceae bacterium]HQR72750.1 Tol-Pal system beta propeller repeat protein TolB [Burkholderiaceae bacterium]